MTVNFKFLPSRKNNNNIVFDKSIWPIAVLAQGLAIV